MCRYGFGNYKPHFACFNCRKVFKRTSLGDYLNQHSSLYKLYSELNPYKQAYVKAPEKLRAMQEKYQCTQAEIQAQYRVTVGKCSQCGSQMADLGLDFKAPRSADIRAWNAIENTYRLGHQFHTCGCDGPGFIPVNPTEYRAYLRKHLTTYQKTYSTLDKRFPDNREAKLEAKAYWAERISKIQVEIDK
ncbi:MAG: hypothetical protein ACPG8W_06695 [Candidatus Promineifilaceae bacterium]